MKKTLMITSLFALLGVLGALYIPISYYFSLEERMERTEEQAMELIQEGNDLICKVGRDSLKRKDLGKIEHLRYCNTLSPEEEVLLMSSDLPSWK